MSRAGKFRSEAGSPFCQIFRGKYEPLDPLSVHNSFDDLGHIGHRDPAVKKVIGLDQNADAARALVEATRRANACFDPGQSPRTKLFF